GGGPRGPGPMGFGPDLRTFIVQRFDSIEAQLAGREEGYIPSGMRMPGGGPGDPGGPGRGGPGQPGGPGERFVKAIIDKADQNADGTITEAEFQAAALAIFQGVDKPESDELDKEGVRNAINSVLPAPSGVMAGLGFGLPSGGPGRFMADPLIAAVDDDGNRLVSQEEWTSGAKRLFKTLSGAKADDAGSKAETAGIDEATLTQNLFSILPHPPGMGPPGMGPPNVGSSRGRDDAGRSARDRGPSGRDSGDRPRGEERPRGDERPSGEERPRRDDRESRRGPPRAGERRGGDERSRGGRGNEPPRSNVRPERPRAPTDDEPTR
ncbi:MAG TPA: hypothetical protein VGE52_16415, partial [Pirellulales bacterium]